MKSISLDIRHAEYFAGTEKLKALDGEAAEAIYKVENGTAPGSDFLGWVKLPAEVPAEEIAAINKCAARLRENCDYVVCVGIGGSFLGAKAVNTALADCFADFYAPRPKRPHVLYAGQNIGEEYMAELQKLLTGKRFGIIVISKSGTTTEPAIAFRILREQLENQVGRDEARDLIVAITDAKKGALRTLADQEKYTTFVIPDNVGGRFSVLTPVGLLPIAVAGHDITKLLAGARDMMCSTEHPGPSNISETYAKMRNALYRDGKKIEILVNFNPKLHYFGEWWKQLYGESEGKDNKGIFPASVTFSTDLHSMGQYIQDGARIMFETVVDIKNPKTDLFLEPDAENLDGLNFLTNQNMSVVNRKAFEGTVLAHTEGGVPNMILELEDTTEESVGYMIYFFEKACAISGYVLGVNPFNQPGVESYKSNMFALLGKPGYEGAKAALEAKLG